MKPKKTSLHAVVRSYEKFLIILFSLVMTSAVNASVLKSQVSLSVKQMPINKVFEQITKQTGVSILYSDNVIDGNQKVSFESNDSSLEEALSLLLKNQNCSFRVEKNQVVLFPVEEKATTTQQKNKRKTITGIVKDENGDPIPFAYVLIKGQSSGTSTLNDGTYELSIPEDVTLIFSYIGYTSLEIPTKGKTRIDVVLREANEVLGEVVVTGFNSVERQHISSAIETVDMEKAQTRPIAKLQEAFSGTVPGVILNKNSSVPGGSSSLNIRGVSTLQNSAPLVIVDGIEQSMDDIDPTQVQSMTVLKDAAAASMYGSRGANGVVVIETKRGETGNFKVNVNTWGAILSSIEKPDFVGAYDYAILTNEAHAAQGLSPAFTDSEIADLQSGKTPQVNWLKKATPKTAHTFNTSANITGGGGVGRFGLMLGYNNEQGETGVEKSNKFSARFNTNINLADKFIIMADFYAHRLTVDRVWDKDNNYANLVYQQAWKMNPTQQIDYPYNPDLIIDAPRHYMLHNDINPVALINEGGFRKNMHDRITINLRPRYYITPKLHLAGDMSYMINKSSARWERMTYKFFDGNGRPVTVWSHEVDSRQGASTSQLTARGTMNYETDLREEKDKLYVVAGSEIMSTNDTDYREFTKASFFGKATYSFDNKYILEAAVRGDGSSKFAPGYQWGIFPSVSGGWNIHNEGFMEKISEEGMINTLKMRASWGKIGNENVDPYLWQEIVNNWGWTMRVPNPEFSWEKQKQFNIGLDFVLLKNRFSGSFDYYNKDSYDLIYNSYPVPPLTGAHNPVTATNVGEVKNKGYEISLNWTDKINKDLRYSFGITFYDNQNSMQKVSQREGATDLPFKDNPNKIWRVGFPIDNFYGYQSQGYFQTQEEVDNTTAKFTGTKVGDIKYVDQNKDGIINDADKVILGDPTPRYNYSVNLNVEYKNWDFYVLGQGVGKRDGSILGLEGQPVINDSNTNSLGTPRKQYMEGRWTPENPNSRFPRMWTGTSPNSYLSDVWMSDASYFRLKSLQVGYTFKTVTKGISNLRLYANAENFLTITNWEGTEPERVRGASGTYPMMATYSLGLQVTFF